MIVHIQTHIDHRKEDGCATEAHLYCHVNKAQYNGLLVGRNVIPVMSVKANIDWKAFNEFLGKEVFFEQDFAIWINLRGVYPEFLAEMPKEFPKEYETNPTRKVKILATV